MNYQSMDRSQEPRHRFENVVNSNQMASLNLSFINRNIELRLNQDLSDIEFEIRHIESLFTISSDKADVFSTLFKTLHRTIEDIDELFFELDHLDPFDISLRLEKIKKLIHRLRDKVKVLANFVYNKVDTLTT